ncbi:flagellar biosynthesis regulator FlaF [Pararhodobacter sp.]|uniref:flagellar biosynthesis regulator FlaF n=1 Tax=Pararhodobacter sp. TaxID=2127056 RepID=UPI002FDCDC83
MSATAKAQSAYGTTTRTIKSPRDIEYELMASITGRIQAAHGDTGPGAFPALAAAMHDNRRLWSAFATDLADNGNQFPKELRARLFYLAEFVGQHTDKALSGAAPAEILVDINLAVMRGLRPQGGH